jgi:hypothetical protein
MSINGIPVRIKTEDKDGKLTQLETVYFPTFRKCPKLAKFPKTISRLETNLDKTRRKLELAYEALNKASFEELDAAAERVDAVKDELLTADKKMETEFDNFVKSGLKAAGYQNPEVERFMGYIDMTRLDELIQCSRMGAGRVDFFTEETPAQPS